MSPSVCLVLEDTVFRSVSWKPNVAATRHWTNGRHGVALLSCYYCIDAAPVLVVSICLGTATVTGV